MTFNQGEMSASDIQVKNLYGPLNFDIINLIVVNANDNYYHLRRNFKV